MTPDEKLEKILFHVNRIDLQQQQILTRLLALEAPAKAVIETKLSRPMVPTELQERAKMLSCPLCGGAMRVQFRKSDQQPFFGCSCYPDCKGIRSGDAQPSQADLAKAAALRAPIPKQTRTVVQPPAHDYADDEVVPF